MKFRVPETKTSLVETLAGKITSTIPQWPQKLLKCEAKTEKLCCLISENLQTTLLHILVKSPRIYLFGRVENEM